MAVVVRWEGPVAYVQGELDNEVWEVLKNKGSHTAVHRKYMTRLSGLGEKEYLREEMPILSIHAKTLAGLSAELLVIEMRRLFKEHRGQQSK